MLAAILVCIYAGVASASYSCSNGTSISESVAEINVGKSKTVNGLGVGVIDAMDIGATRRLTAEIMVDAKAISLDNITSSEEIELLNEDYTVSLVNSTDDNAIINVGGSSATISLQDSGDIGGLKVYLVSSEGAYPFAITAIVGKKIISLSSDENSSQIISINGTDYGTGLFSASNSGATIKVDKCPSGKIIEVKDIVPVINTTRVNATIINNTTPVNNNATTNVTNTANETNPTAQKEKGQACTENNQCKTDYCKSGKCAEPGFFSRIILWFKNLFG